MSQSGSYDGARRTSGQSSWLRGSPDKGKHDVAHGAARICLQGCLHELTTRYSRTAQKPLHHPFLLPEAGPPLRSTS